MFGKFLQALTFGRFGGSANGVVTGNLLPMAKESSIISENSMFTQTEMKILKSVYNGLAVQKKSNQTISGAREAFMLRGLVEDMAKQDQPLAKLLDITGEFAAAEEERKMNGGETPMQRREKMKEFFKKGAVF